MDILHAYPCTENNINNTHGNKNTHTHTKIHTTTRFVHVPQQKQIHYNLQKTAINALLYLRLAGTRRRRHTSTRRSRRAL
mmetsp:Transcript_5565/g.9345  ORF Transcript_5565/g.9345 Transcript_5565/m.9345 type:complete len:80 (+) Transcript_5565:51-290(+)